MALQRFGGSFAPPLTDELMAEYKALIAAVPAGLLRDILAKLYECCEKWWNLPESTNGQTARHGSGVGTIVKLDDAIREELWAITPWEEEIAAYEPTLDAISPKAEPELRDAAFHLLWHVKEINLDREPMTSDKL